MWIILPSLLIFLIKHLSLISIQKKTHMYSLVNFYDLNIPCNQNPPRLRKWDKIGTQKLLLCLPWSLHLLFLPQRTIILLLNIIVSSIFEIHINGIITVHTLLCLATFSKYAFSSVLKQSNSLYIFIAIEIFIIWTYYNLFIHSIVGVHFSSGSVIFNKNEIYFYMSFADQIFTFQFSIY